jgi:hypothetical protein
MKVSRIVWLENAPVRGKFDLHGCLKVIKDVPEDLSEGGDGQVEGVARRRCQRKTLSGFRAMNDESICAPIRKYDDFLQGESLPPCP